MSEHQGKISALLTAFLDGVPADQPVEIIVQTALVDPPPEGSRNERMARMKQQFEQSTTALTEVVNSLRGDVLDSSWLNSSLRVRVPARAVDTIAALDAVRRLDLVTNLQPDD